MFFKIIFFFTSPIISVFSLFLKNKTLAVFFIATGSYLGFLGSLHIGGQTITLFHLAMVLAFFVFIFSILFKKNITIHLTGMELEWSIFLGLIFLSLIYSMNRNVGLEYALRFSSMIVMIYLIYNLLRDKYNVLTIIIGITIVGTILAIASAVSGFTPENIMLNYVLRGKTNVGRTEVSIDDPNIFASHFILPIMFSASLFLTNNISKKFKLAGLIALPILLVGIAATFSRSGWLAIALGLFLLAVLKRKFQVFIWIALSFVILLFLIPELRFLAENLLRRLLKIFEGSQDTSSNIRIMLILASFHMIVDSYMLGIGFRSFPIYFTNYYQPAETTGVVESHNLFATIFVELGLLGFLLLIWILFKIARKAYTNYIDNTDSLCGAVNVTLFLSLISYIFFYQLYGGALYDNNLWIIVALIFTMSKEPSKISQSVSKVFGSR